MMRQPYSEIVLSMSVLKKSVTIELHTLVELNTPGILPADRATRQARESAGERETQRTKAPPLLIVLPCQGGDDPAAATRTTGTTAMPDRRTLGASTFRRIHRSRNHNRCSNFAFGSTLFFRREGFPNPSLGMTLGPIGEPVPSRQKRPPPSDSVDCGPNSQDQEPERSPLRDYPKRYRRLPNRQVRSSSQLPSCSAFVAASAFSAANFFALRFHLIARTLR